MLHILSNKLLIFFKKTTQQSILSYSSGVGIVNISKITSLWYICMKLLMLLSLLMNIDLRNVAASGLCSSWSCITPLICAIDFELWFMSGYGEYQKSPPSGTYV